MEKRFHVMLVEDNVQLSQSIKSFFNMKKDIEISWIAQNSLKAIEMFEDGMPDLIILDLVMPHADGFVLLEHLKENEYENKPEVIVLSSLNHEAIIKRACEYGAIYYMAKPFSMVDLHDRIMSILTIRDPVSTKQQEPDKKEPARQIEHVHQMEPQQSENLELETIFMNVGISPHTKGFLFLCSAVELVKQNSSYIFSLTKELYPEIARRCSTTPANVEHSIRHSIDVAWKSGKLMDLNRIFKINAFSHQYKPSNGEFISVLTKLFLAKSKMNFMGS